MDSTKECVICSLEIDVQATGWTGGHNAAPVKDGQCCSFCNEIIVIPTRIREWIVKLKQHSDSIVANPTSSFNTPS